MASVAASRACRSNPWWKWTDTRSVEIVRKCRWGGNEAARTAFGAAGRRRSAATSARRRAALPGIPLQRSTRPEHDRRCGPTLPVLHSPPRPRHRSRRPGVALHGSRQHDEAESGHDVHRRAGNLRAGPGKLGVRHEDTLAVGEGGCESLGGSWSGTPEDPGPVVRARDGGSRACGRPRSDAPRRRPRPRSRWRRRGPRGAPRSRSSPPSPDDRARTPHRWRLPPP